jgi:hypothetical protein
LEGKDEITYLQISGLEMPPRELLVESKKVQNKSRKDHASLEQQAVSFLVLRPRGK